MMSINGDGVCHPGPPGSFEVPEIYLPTVKRALSIIESRISGADGCDKIFKSLPGGRSFSDLFDSGDLWINYDPSNKKGDWGWTMPKLFANDIVVSQFALRMGHWSTCGTIVHEIAHLNGADGTSHAAEETLKSCKLQSAKGPYDPKIRG